MSRRTARLVAVLSALLIIPTFGATAVAAEDAPVSVDEATRSESSTPQRAEQRERVQNWLTQHLGVKGARSRAGATGNTVETAAVLPFGEPQFSTLQDIDDLDVWRLDVPELRYVSVQMDELPVDYDLYLALDTGEVIAASDRPGTTAESIYGGLEPGTYYVLVVPFDDPDLEQSYRLSADYDPEASLPAAPQTMVSLDYLTMVGPVIGVGWTDLDDVRPWIYTHEVQASVDGGPWKTMTDSPDDSGYSFSATGGHTYSVRVAAINGMGRGEFSEPRTLHVATPPQSPTVALTTDGRTIRATWADGDDGGEPITKHALMVRQGQGSWDSLGTTTGTSKDFVGQPGATYQFKAQAQNAAGWSNDSEIARITVPQVPAAGWMPTLRLQGRTLTVTWQDAATGGSPITGHAVQVAKDDGSWQTLTEGTTDPSFSFDAEPGHDYRVRVAATNAIGTGEYGAARPASVPTTPNVTLKADGGDITATWPDTSAGAMANGYLVRWTTDGTTWTQEYVSEPTFTFKGDPGRTHTVQVAGHTTWGSGDFSEPQHVTLANLPAAPAATVTQKDGRITVTWEDGHDGGSPIVGHTVDVASRFTASFPTDTTSWSFDGQPGQTYTVTVASSNSVGKGAASVPVRVSIPAPKPTPTPTPTVKPEQVSKPNAPTGLTVRTLRKGKVAVAWNRVATATSYTMDVYRAGKWRPLTTVTKTKAKATIGAKPGTKVKVRVRAGNAAGPGLPAISPAVTTK